MRQQENISQYRELELIDISRNAQGKEKTTTYQNLEIPLKPRDNVVGTSRATDRSRHKRKQRAERRRKRRCFVRRLAGGICAAVLLMAIVSFIREYGGDIVSTVNGIWQQSTGEFEQGIPIEEFATHPTWTEDFLTRNEYSRPGSRLPKVTNIFVHYTANPGSSAAQNHSYFEQQKDTHERSVSSHFIIGYEGEILQCVPLNEVAYAVKTRNYDSISIECCHLAEDGSFTQATYDSLIGLLAWLIDVYDLEAEDILRHYDCGGKKCPLYYTEHEDAWEQLKRDVERLKNG